MVFSYESDLSIQASFAILGSENDFTSMTKVFSYVTMLAIPFRVPSAVLSAFAYVKWSR